MDLRLGLPLLAASILALSSFAGRSAAEPAGRISGPSVHENIAVYFVHGPSAPGPVPLTLQEALAKGAVEVLETGNVQELKMRNIGKEPVFVQFGDIVKGGQQDRVLTVSMVIEPGSGLIPIGAYCVEQGRWAVRGKEDARRFALSDQVMPSREAKLAMASSAKPAAPRPETTTGAPAEPPASVAGFLRRSQEDIEAALQQRRLVTGSGGANAQHEVWRNVSKVQEALTSALAVPVASEKSRTSLQLALENEKLRQAQDAYVAALSPAATARSDIVGVVFAINGRLSSADVYPSNGLFRKMWPKLARAAATEALTGKAQSSGSRATGTASDAPRPNPEAPSIAAVAAFLDETEKGAVSERVIPNVVRLEARENAAGLLVEARSGTGAFVHRNYLAK